MNRLQVGDVAIISIFTGYYSSPDPINVSGIQIHTFAFKKIKNVNGLIKYKTYNYSNGQSNYIDLTASEILAIDDKFIVGYVFQNPHDECDL